MCFVVPSLNIVLPLPYLGRAVCAVTSAIMTVIFNAGHWIKMLDHE